MRAQDYPIDRSIGFQLGRTFRRLRPIMEQQINSAGISYGMWFFLRALWERDGVSQREIAEMVGLTQPTAWAALRKLEAQKMVTLRPDEEDKRRVLVFLTERGKGLEEVLLPRVEHINEVALQGISNAELATFQRVLRKIEANISPAD
ncbi:MAG: MarR family transcriptional regulator [Pigmentiphaga sp.]|uniref:MarR family winged helix-turn-helix transcriptional regulator n=1 Tax=Pigmentiphaga sp. TaxID=1977564 RepID=UPI0029BD5AB7|nr:MarR family transcriptional regulator [Pigmentiphaga sp.]MDX3905772.1 MarR family transcriptional regulator [Pigmentiphaga sp.]